MKTPQKTLDLIKTTDDCIEALKQLIESELGHEISISVNIHTVAINFVTETPENAEIKTYGSKVRRQFKTLETKQNVNWYMIEE